MNLIQRGITGEISIADRKHQHRGRAIGQSAAAPSAFPDATDHALICNHDDGMVSKLNLAAGVANKQFATGSGCECIQFR